MAECEFCSSCNRPFPSSLVPLFQSESKCETILIKMTLICMKMKLHAELIFIMKGFALRLVLKQRHKRTRKWPIHDRLIGHSSFLARITTRVNKISQSKAVFTLSNANILRYRVLSDVIRLDFCPNLHRAKKYATM